VRVALFAACFNELLFPETPRAVVELLERLGHTVEFPEAQTCCGQMHANSGYRREAMPLLRRFVATFESYEAIVSPSASCVGMVRESYPRLVEGDRELSAAVAELAPRVYELTELLVDVLGVEDVGARLEARAVYHPTCHSLRGLRLGDRPLRLLRAVRDLELAELPRADECCGFGGTFAVKNAAVSTAMLEDKLADVSASGAQLVVAVDNSCLMHIGGGARHARLPIETRHLAEILVSR
jgi:L-lactate dehydrogenase complex protein LldE